MNFIYGALGMVLIMAVFAAGVLVGWKVRDKVEQNRIKIHEQELNEKERQQLIEEQQAFSTMLGYNPDMAYGIDRPIEAILEE